MNFEFKNSLINSLAYFPRDINVLLAQPRGFCAGVVRAIDIVEQALSFYNGKVYVRHQIVHNAFVVKDLEKKGAIFIKELSEVPNGSNVIFSAHGVSKAVEEEAKIKSLNIIDATCPLVKKVHNEVERYSNYNKKTILIGHKNHPEVIGIIGRVKSKVYLVENMQDIDLLDIDKNEPVAYVTQTTLSIYETEKMINYLIEKFPKIKSMEKQDICYATSNRQEAVLSLSGLVDVMFVIGSVHSSNSLRLVEVAKNKGVLSYLLESEKDISLDCFFQNNINTIGITLAASAPEILADNVIKKLGELFSKVNIYNMIGVKEDIFFKTPVIN